MRVIKTKLHGLVSKEQSRYGIAAIQFDAEKNRVAATNGKALAILPAEVEEGDHSAIIDAGLWAEKRRKGEMVAATINGCATMPNGKVFPNMECHYPDVDQVIPKFNGKTVKLCIDPKLLFTLAEAMGRDNDNTGVMLEMQANEKGLVVDYISVTNNIDFNGEKAIGVIMPTRSL